MRDQFLWKREKPMARISSSTGLQRCLAAVPVGTMPCSALIVLVLVIALIVARVSTFGLKVARKSPAYMLR